MSKKDFNKGLESGIKIRNELDKKDIQVLETLLKEAKLIIEGQEATKEVIHTLIKELSDQEIERLFGIKASLSVVDLEIEEKKILLNVIATLANKLGNDYNENQKEFFINLKNYLEVLDYSENLNYDLEQLENIDSHEICLVLARVISNFLFLTYEDCQFFDEYDYLFVYLYLRNKEIINIKQTLNNTYKLFGVQGIVSVYGSYEEEENGDSVPDNIIRIMIDSGKMENIKLDSSFKISSGETKEFSNANVYVNTDIICEGVIKFENCIIHYNSNKIELWGGSTIFENCKFVNECLPQFSFIWEIKKANKIIFNKCYFENCMKLLFVSECEEILINECYFKECTCLLRIEGTKKTVIEKSIFEDCYGRVIDANFDDIGEVRIVKCKVEISEEKDINNQIEFYCWGTSIFSDVIVENKSDRTITFRSHFEEYHNCKFTGIRNAIVSGTKKIVDSVFIDCEDVVGSSALIRDCYFRRCTKVIDSSEKVSVIDCMFNECYGTFIHLWSSGGDSIIKDCEFYNVSPEVYGIEVGGNEDTRGVEIVNCIFKGVEIDGGYLIGNNSGFREKINCVAKIKDCLFEDCTTERKDMKIIDEQISCYGAFNKRKRIDAVSIWGCTGLDSVKVNSKVGYYNVKKDINNDGKKIGPSMTDMQVEVI